MKVVLSWQMIDARFHAVHFPEQWMSKQRSSICTLRRVKQVSASQVAQTGSYKGKKAGKRKAELVADEKKHIRYLPQRSTRREAAHAQVSAYAYEYGRSKHPMNARLLGRAPAEDSSVDKIETGRGEATCSVLIPMKRKWVQLEDWAAMVVNVGSSEPRVPANALLPAKSSPQNPGQSVHSRCFDRHIRLGSCSGQ